MDTAAIIEEQAITQAESNDGSIRPQFIGARVFFAHYQSSVLGYAGTPQAALSMVLHARNGTGTYDRNPQEHKFSRIVG